MLTRPALDLTRYHLRHRHGDITVFLTWWLAEDSGPLPCLVLVPTNDQSWERCTPCVVPINHAWVWSEEKGDPVRAAKMAVGFVDALRQAPSPQSAFRVRGIIIDHLGDLLTMPPMPASMRQRVVLGEAKVTAREAGRVIRHEEVVERI